MLDFAAVAIANAPTPQILDVEAGPELAAWDAALSGAVAGALADHLVAVVHASHTALSPAPDTNQGDTP
jgi:hypothetical protein